MSKEEGEISTRHTQKKKKERQKGKGQPSFSSMINKEYKKEELTRTYSFDSSKLLFVTTGKTVVETKRGRDENKSMAFYIHVFCILTDRPTDIFNYILDAHC